MCAGAAIFLAERDGANVAFSPDGRRILAESGSTGGDFTLFSADTGEETCKLRDANATRNGFAVVARIEISPDGRLAATRTTDGKVRIWRLPDPNAQQPNLTRVPQTTPSSPSAITPATPFSPTTIAPPTTSAARVPDMPKEPGVWQRLDVDEKTSPDLQFLPDSRRIATFGAKGTRIWNFQTGECRSYEHADGVSPDGQYLGGHAQPILSVETGLPVNPAGLAVNGRRFYLFKRKELVTVRFDLDRGIALLPPQAVNWGFSADGRYSVGVGRNDNQTRVVDQIRVFNAETNEVLATFEHRLPIYSVAYGPQISPNGELVLTSSVEDDIFSLWNDANGDGKIDDGEAGLGLFTVQLETTSNTLLATATTNVFGDFSFAALAAGTYEVKVVPITGLAATKPTGGVLTIKLAAGQASTGNLFGERAIA